MNPVELTMHVLGVDRPTAEFIRAIEAGEIDGDVIILDERGEPIRRDPDVQARVFRHLGIKPPPDPA